MAEPFCSTFSKDPDASFWVLPGLDEAHSALFHPDLTALILLENCGKFSHLVATFSKGQLRFYLVELLQDDLGQPKTLKLTKITESESAQMKFQQFQLGKKTPSKICIVKSIVECVNNNTAEKEGGNHNKSKKDSNQDLSLSQIIEKQQPTEEYFSSASSDKSKTISKCANSETEIFQATIGLSMDKIIYLFKVNFNKSSFSSWEVSSVEVQAYEYNGQMIQSFSLSNNGNSILCSTFDSSENLVNVYIDDTFNSPNRCLICSLNQNKEVLIGRIGSSNDMSIIRAFIQIPQNKQMYIYTFYFDPIKRSLLTLNRLPITTSLSQQNNLRNPLSIQYTSNPNINTSCSLFSETCGVGIISDGCSLEIHDFNAHSSKPVLKETSIQIYNFDPQTLLVANSTRNIITNNINTTSIITTPNNDSNPTTIQPSSLALYSFNAPYQTLEQIPLPSFAKVYNILSCPTNPNNDKSDTLENDSQQLILSIMDDEYSTIIPIIIDTNILLDKLPELQTVGSQITLFNSRLDLENIPSKSMFKTPEATKMSNNIFNFQVFSSLGLSLSQNFGFSSPDKSMRQAQSQEKSRGNQGSKGKNEVSLDFNTPNLQQRQNRLLFTENSITQEAAKYSAQDQEDHEFMQKYKAKGHQYFRKTQTQKSADGQYKDDQKEEEYEENNEIEYENSDELDQESYAFCSNSSDSKGECEECRQKKERQFKKKQIKSHSKQHNQKNNLIGEINHCLRSIQEENNFEEEEEVKSRSQFTKKSKKVHRNNKRNSCGNLDLECEQQQENTISFSDRSESPCKSSSPIRQKRSSPQKKKHKSFAFSLNLVSPPAKKSQQPRNVQPFNLSNLQSPEERKDIYYSENTNSFAPRQLLVKRRISPKRQSNQQDIQESNKLLHLS